MRHLLAVTAAGLLLVSSAAFAQSNRPMNSPANPVQPQGPAQPNYLGAHPADGATSAGGSGVVGGSGQGGYTGTLPGRDTDRSGQTMSDQPPPVQPHR
ncbi:MAG: hypothetical protein JO021_03530 [Alphaproteobacteria bacterium]|nr:hypothetical protein [Alphaproteobacteria bacterium]